MRRDARADKGRFDRLYLLITNECARGLRMGVVLCIRKYVCAYERLRILRYGRTVRIQKHGRKRNRKIHYEPGNEHFRMRHDHRPFRETEYRWTRGEAPAGEVQPLAPLICNTDAVSGHVCNTYI